jgi:ribosomal protein S27AE
LTVSDTPSSLPNPAAASAATPADLPAPMQGCLYCGAEGSVVASEGNQKLTCGTCGAIARFEPGTDADHWRINYQKYSHAPRFYYVMVHLGRAGWLDADAALNVAEQGFIYRHRLQQAQRGELGWLKPTKMETPPPLMSPAETVYIHLTSAAIFHAQRANGLAALFNRNNGIQQDSGQIYITDLKIHLIGKTRDWSHKLSDIQRIDHNEKHWRLYVGDGTQFYQGENVPGQIDAQLFATVVKILWKRD